jgi:WD40 repeat protein
MSSRLPKRLVVVVGTYDGVLAGWDTASTPPPAPASATHDDDGMKNSTKRVTDGEDIEGRLTRKMNDGKYLKMTFATAAHEGSVRCIDVTSSASAIASTSLSTSTASSPYGPGMLLSGGYDESINVYDLQKRSQNGELRTPADMGSPSCCSFAPPSNRVVVPSASDDDDDDDEDDDIPKAISNSANARTTSTHAIIGTSAGKVVIYKRSDWSVQHVLSGHGTGGVHCLAVHPTGRMALSGGTNDGKLILWDLVKGRLAYVHRIRPTGNRGRSGPGGKDNDGSRMESINHVAWCGDGTRYAYCHGSRIVARDATTGEDLLDVDMSPNCSRVNMVTFVGGDEGMFLAAACDDGGLPVLEVGQLFDDDDDDDDDEGEEDDVDDDGGRVKKPATRRAIMAIEPVDGVVAGDERFKCIRSVEGGSGFLVVTANSGGVVSIMDLEGAVRMMLTPDRYGDEDDDDDDGRKSSSSKRNKGKDDDEDDQSTDSSSSSSDDDEEVEAAVEILDSVRVGSGARITDLAVWSYGGRRNDDDIDPDDDDDASSREEDGDDTSDDDDEGEDEGKDDDEGGGSVAIVAKTSVEEKGGGKRKMHHPSTTTRGNRGGHNGRDDNRIELDPEAVERARKLVGQAKEHEKRKKRKLSKKS